jgi:AraC family transcriptional regulator
MRETVGIGDFIPWEGGCLLIGRALSVTPLHSHYAIQIGVGSERGIRFRAHERDAWIESGVDTDTRMPQ